MIRHAGSAKLAAVSVALVLHGALAVALGAQDETLIEGADGAAEVRLGNAFADMAAGTLTAVRPDQENAEAVQPVTADETVKPVTPVEAIKPETALASKRPAAATEIVQSVAAPRAQPVAPSPVRPAKATDSASPALAQTVQSPEPERIEGAPPESAAVAQSLRPKPRSARIEAAAKPTPKPKAKPAPPSKPKPGNAPRAAQAGEATGRAEAVARQSGSGGRKAAAGNAAASNYPGLVMRKLSRAGKPRVSARGSAVVAFHIGSNGGLTAVSLARSSGSAALDRAALALVRGAGPFPKPPSGARRSFSIQIKGR